MLKATVKQLGIIILLASCQSLAKVNASHGQREGGIQRILAMTEKEDEAGINK
jgi:hypothetical protein